MKKNLLSFIGSIVALFSVFFLNAPYLSYGANNSSKTTVISIQNFLGLPGRYSSSPVYLPSVSMGGILFTFSLFAAFAALIIVITGIIQKKNVNDKALILSSANAFTAFYLIKSNINLFGSEKSDYTIGWGLVCVSVFFLAFFTLCLIGFIISGIADKKAANNH